jgi:hypothetical protein
VWQVRGRRSIRERQHPAVCHKSLLQLANLPNGVNSPEMGTERVDALIAELSATVGRALTRVPMNERPLVPVLAADAGCPLMKCKDLRSSESRLS